MWTRSAVFSTDDGGQRWHERWTAPFITMQFVPHADFISAQQGWIVVTSSMSPTDTSSLFSTNDGGATWNELPIDPQFLSISEIDFVDDQYGWMVAYNHDQVSPMHVLRTTDGGMTWTKVATPCAPSWNVDTHRFSFGSRTNGWAICTNWDGSVSSRQLFSTTDGGQHWQERMLPQSLAPPAPSGYPYGSDPGGPSPLPLPSTPMPVFFLDEMDDWIGGQNGNVFMTNDAGQTWHRITVAPQRYHPVNDIQFWSTSQGVVRLNGALFRTTDAGATWHRDGSGLRPSRVQFFDQQNGVGATYAAEGAVLLRTADGGRSWSIAGELTPECYEGQTLHFVDPTHGWSLGRAQNVSEAPPILCRTTDGGHTWTQLPDLPAAGAAAISFLDANTGYLGNTGSPWSMLTPQLQVTHDGGATFMPVSMEPVSANQIEFISPRWAGSWPIGSYLQLRTAACRRHRSRLDTVSPPSISCPVA